MSNLNVRISDDELEILKEYCAQVDRTQTDVLRAFIRGLEHKIKSIKPEDVNPLVLPSVPYSRKSKLPECPGLYFVISTQNELLYLGRAKNIKKRWVGERKFRFDVANCRISWLELQPSKANNEFERDCIRRLKPTSNIQFTENEAELRKSLSSLNVDI